MKKGHGKHGLMVGRKYEPTRLEECKSGKVVAVTWYGNFVPAATLHDWKLGTAGLSTQNTRDTKNPLAKTGS